MDGGACPNCGATYRDCVAIPVNKWAKTAHKKAGRCCDGCSHPMGASA